MTVFVMQQPCTVTAQKEESSSKAAESERWSCNTCRSQVLLFLLCKMDVKLWAKTSTDDYDWYIFLEETLQCDGVENWLKRAGIWRLTEQGKQAGLLAQPCICVHEDKGTMDLAFATRRRDDQSWQLRNFRGEIELSNSSFNLQFTRYEYTK